MLGTVCPARLLEIDPFLPFSETRKCHQCPRQLSFSSSNLVEDNEAAGSVCFRSNALSRSKETVRARQGLDNLAPTPRSLVRYVVQIQFAQ